MRHRQAGEEDGGCRRCFIGDDRKGLIRKVAGFSRPAVAHPFGAMGKH